MDPVVPLSLYSPECVEKEDSPKSICTIVHRSPALWRRSGNLLCWMDMQPDEGFGDCNHARGCLMYTARPRLPKPINKKRAAGE